MATPISRSIVLQSSGGSSNRDWRSTRGILSIAFAESRKCAGRMRGFPRQKDRWLTNTRRAECGRRSSASFPRCVGPAHDLFVPGRVIALSEMQRDVAAYYGPECTALCEHAHVNVNQKFAIVNSAATGCKNTEHSAASEIPRDPFRKPQYDSSQQQYDRGVKKAPEQQFLPAL